MALCGHTNATNYYIYVPLQGHNIGTILQLDGCYGAITWPLIKYYQFTIYPHKM
jgi:hypothetical protein